MSYGVKSCQVEPTSWSHGQSHPNFSGHLKGMRSFSPSHRRRRRGQLLYLHPARQGPSDDHLTETWIAKKLQLIETCNKSSGEPLSPSHGIDTMGKVLDK